ncbi:pentatricopeptide repeat-containing protein-like [Iris pallida]|uniref:Pentatricopeptide repeat-containing protein-like n=1 Tax=Iris pallida TaxID=29817 RepID=A0AAX6DZE8_IRIPA|nr:pentatricopeptide repeat-containing protein-like [Iris pallida]
MRRALQSSANIADLNFFRSLLRIPPPLAFSSNGYPADDENSKSGSKSSALDEESKPGLESLDLDEGPEPGSEKPKFDGEDRKPRSEKLDFDEESMPGSERLDFGYVPDETLVDTPLVGPYAEERFDLDNGCTPRCRFYRGVELEADLIFRTLQQDMPGFDAWSALNELCLKMSSALVREVLLLILVSIDRVNKSRCAKLTYRFFTWSGQQKDYRHTPNAYNIAMKIFAETEELKAMWRLVDEMTERGLPITACTFNILICTCGQAGMARRVVERFLKTKNFNYRPFKHSFNAILHSLLTVHQYRLIEWVYQKMLLDGQSPDVLTYNVVMRAKYRLGKLDQFHRMLDEMGKSGFAPDLHTYNLLLHVLGKGDKPLAALNLLNYMDDVGCYPRVLHFTTLIDGLSRAGNLDACKYFFDEMVKKGCKPDVVCYTVMITGYVVATEFEKAQELFDDMLSKGQLPNVFTYNSMIRGLCFAGKFEEACSLLKAMDGRGCTPNFSVYSSLVGRLRNAGKLAEANDIIKHMRERGHYLHLLSKFRGYRRC